MILKKYLQKTSPKYRNYYFTIKTTAVAEFKDRGSRFLAYSFPIKNSNDFKKYLHDLKKNTQKLRIIVLLTEPELMEIISDPAMMASLPAPQEK